MPCATDTALDIVQEAMLKLAEKYGARPAPELPLVFQRIVQNAIHDYFRRARVWSFWTLPRPLLRSSGAQDDDSDPLESLEVDLGVKIAEPSGGAVERAQTVGLIEKALEALPPSTPGVFAALTRGQGLEKYRINPTVCACSNAPSGNSAIDFTPRSTCRLSSGSESSSRVPRTTIPIRSRACRWTSA